MKKVYEMTWKVYGREGHRQKESFYESYDYNFSVNGNTRKISVKNADITGTNDYSIVTITCNTKTLCEDELDGQITDGIFENSQVGKVELVSEREVEVEEVEEAEIEAEEHKEEVNKMKEDFIDVISMLDDVVQECFTFISDEGCVDEFVDTVKYEAAIKKYHSLL